MDKVNKIDENKLTDIAKNFYGKVKQLGQSISRETKETIQAANILLKILMNKSVSSEEVSFLKSQSLDFVKILALLGLQAVPGSSLAVIALEKAGKKYGFSIFPQNQMALNNEVRSLVRTALKEYITPKDLKNVEQYADDLFSDVGVDVEFTKHFLDRVNDLRNKEDITTDELKWLYQKAHDRYASTISNLKPGEERVLTDPDTQINIPIAMNWDGKSNDIDMVGKTVMRKKDFKSYTPKLRLEQVDDDTLSRMRDFGMDENDIDENGYVTLYHGGLELPERLNPDEIFFLTNDYSSAEDYAKIRGEQNDAEGQVFTIKVKPEDVSWNTGSYEIEFDRGGLISRRNGFLTIIPKTEENIDVPINVGDTVLGGKFKNKKIKVKDIDKNEKGDITINDKPLLRFRTIQEDFSPSKDFYESIVKVSYLYVEADNMLDAYYKAKNSTGPSSRSTDKPLTISKLLDGSLILLDGHHRIADSIKYMDNPTLKKITNLKFKAIIHKEKINSIEDMPKDFQYWIPFIDWLYTTFNK